MSQGSAHLYGLGKDKAVVRTKEKAQDFALDLKAVVDGIRASGVAYVRGIALELDKSAISPERGSNWSLTRNDINRLPGYPSTIATRVIHGNFRFVF